MRLPTAHPRRGLFPSHRHRRPRCAALALAAGLGLAAGAVAPASAGASLATSVPGKAAAQKVADKADKALLKGEGRARDWSAVYALLPPSIRSRFKTVKQYEKSLKRRGSAVLVSLHQSGPLAFGIASGDPAAEQPVTFTVLNGGVRSQSTGVVELVAEKGKWWLIGAASNTSTTTTTTKAP
jgi:hypothetical protein